MLLTALSIASSLAYGGQGQGGVLPCAPKPVLSHVARELREAPFPLGPHPSGLLDSEARRVARIQTPVPGERLSLHVGQETESQIFTIVSTRDRRIVLRSDQGRELSLSSSEYLLLLGEQFPTHPGVSRYERWNYIADQALEHERSVGGERRRGPRYAPDFIQARDRIMVANAEARRTLTQGEGRFARITAADNAHYESLTVGVAPNPNRVVFSAEMPILKEVNDSFLGDSGMATSAVNLFNNLLMDQVMAGPLRAQVRGQYFDYKGIRFAFEANTAMNAAQIEERVAAAYQAARLQFAQRMRQLGLTPLVEFQGLGIAGRFENWFLAGIGNTNDQANLAARFARDLNNTQNIPLQNIRDSRLRIGQRLQESEAQRRVLQRSFGPESRAGGLLEPLTGHPHVLIPSEGAVDIFRKAGRNSEAGRERLRARFGVEVSETQYDALYQYLESVDRFAPSLVIRERIDLGIDQMVNGVSLDFAGVGARNLRQVSEDLASSFIHPGSDSRHLDTTIVRIRQGEQVVTQRLDRQREQVRQIFDRTLTTNSHHQTGPQLRFSGDDGILRIDGTLEDSQVQGLVRRLAGMDSPVGPVSGLRLTGTGRGLAATGAEAAQVIKRNEEFLKRYSRELEVVFAGNPQVREGLLRTVILSEPLAQQNGRVGYRLTVATQLDVATQQQMREVATRIAAEAGVEARLETFAPVRELPRAR